MTANYRRMALTDAVLGAAMARAGALPLFENSRRKREANLVGCIGEVVFESFLHRHGIDFRDHRESARHDYVVGGLSIDVKSKDRTALPERHFDNSVPLYNHEHQRPD